MFRDIGRKYWSYVFATLLQRNLILFAHQIEFGSRRLFLERTFDISKDVGTGER